MNIYYAILFLHLGFGLGTFWCWLQFDKGWKEYTILWNNTDNYLAQAKLVSMFCASLTVTVGLGFLLPLTNYIGRKYMERKGNTQPA